MNVTLVTFVVLYLLGTLAIGVWAGTRIKNTSDFAIAGRSLPLIMVVTTTFATWFGAETVMGIPAKFVQSGLNAIVEDPFGAGTCLILVGLFFAARLYKQNLLTIGDFSCRRRRQGDHDGHAEGAVELPAAAELHRDRDVRRRWPYDDARQHPAAGRVPARDVGEERADGAQRRGDRRHQLHLFRLRADVHRLLRRRRDGLERAGHGEERLPAPAAHLRADEDAAGDADPLLRRAAVGHQEHLVGHLAGAVDQLRREHPEEP